MNSPNGFFIVCTNWERRGWGIEKGHQGGEGGIYTIRRRNFKLEGKREEFLGREWGTGREEGMVLE